jgi:hypothetical protein
MVNFHQKRRFLTAKRFICLCFLLAFGVPGVYPAGNQESVPVTILASTTFYITADISSLTLDFSDFISGAVSESIVVNYTVVANDARASTNVISASLNSAFQGMQLQAKFGTYVNNGGNARLTAKNANFVNIGTASLGLANKQRISGTGRLINGAFPITYQVRATQDLEAGSQSRVLTITFIDQ